MKRNRQGGPILELFAFVAQDGLGEGLVAFSHGNMMMPMVAADTARVEDLKVFVKDIAGSSGKKIRLVKFSERTDVEEILP